MSWLLRIPDVEDTDRVGDHLWALGTSGFAELPQDRPLGATETDSAVTLLAGFDDETEAIAASEILGGSVEPVDPSIWATDADATSKPITVGPITMQIDGATAFGHGEHPTTRLALDAIDGLVNADGERFESVLDVGSGTGVLAIAAARLAEHAGWSTPAVTALDIEPAAQRSTHHNAEVNNVSLTVGSTLNKYTEPADLVVANLLLADLRPIASAIRDATANCLITTGFLVDQEADVRSLLAPLEVIDRSTHDDWACLVLQRPRPRVTDTNTRPATPTPETS